MPAKLEDLERMCRNIGDALRGVMPPQHVYFVWMAAPGWATYTSNAQRADMVRELRELADRLERGSDT